MALSLSWESFTFPSKCWVYSTGCGGGGGDNHFFFRYDNLRIKLTSFVFTPPLLSTSTQLKTFRIFFLCRNSKKIYFLSNSFDNDNGDDGDVGADENDKRSVIKGYNNEIEQKAGFHEIGLLTHPALHPLIAHVQLDISSQIVEKKGFQTSSDP